MAKKGNKPRPTKKTPPKKTRKAAAGTPQPTVAEFDAAEQALLVNTHIPAFKNTKDRLGKANSAHRTVLKAAKADGFTKDDLEFAIACQDAEAEAREKAKLRRKVVIARMVGSDLAQLDLFDSSNTGIPVEERAYQEGKMASVNNQPAKPDYAPDTKAHAEYMRGFHEHQEGMLKDGIKKKEAEKSGKGKNRGNGKHPPVKADQSAKTAAAPPVDPSITSGVPTSRSQFLAQQAARQAAAQAPHHQPPSPAAPAAAVPAVDEDDEDEGSAFKRRA